VKSNAIQGDITADVMTFRTGSDYMADLDNRSKIGTAACATYQQVEASAPIFAAFAGTAFAPLTESG